MSPLTAKPVSGHAFDITISLGLPYQRDDGPWACPVAIEGLYPTRPDIVGEDSLQALCLALSLVRTLLQQYLDEGGRLLVPGTDDDYPLDAMFSGVGPRPERNGPGVARLDGCRKPASATGSGGCWTPLRARRRSGAADPRRDRAAREGPAR